MKSRLFTILVCLAAFLSASTRASAAADAPATQPTAQSSLDHFESLVNALKLDDEQKPKVAKLFAKARDSYKALEKETDAKVREEKTRAISTDLRQSLADILNEEQKRELISRMPRPVNTDAIIDRIKKELNKPGSKLTEEQKTQADEILDDTKKKLADLRADSEQNHTDNRDKIQSVLSEMKTRLNAVLNAPPKE